jgi:hypothetical protein
MHEEIVGDLEGVSLTSFYLPEEIPGVELVDLLNVPKDDAALPPQSLWYIWPLEFWYVILDHIS